MNQRLACAAVFAAISIIVQINAQDSNPEYSSIMPRHAVADEPSDEVELGCQTTGSQYDGATLKWWRNDAEIAETEDKYSLRENNTLRVSKVDYLKDLGEYKCVFTLADSSTTQEAVVLLQAKAYVNKFDKSKNLVQGDTLTLRCDAYGYPAPSTVWFKDDEMLMRDDRTDFEDHEHVKNGTLKVMDVDYPDAGEYGCTAINDFGQYNATITIRVKDKLAALWPFLGICAEVLILCIIIFIYEKRRAKKMAEEDAKEEADALTNSHATRDADVRQRKV